MKARILAFLSLFITLFAGCGGGFKPGETKLIDVPPPVIKEGSSIEFGIYPAAYTIGNELYPFVNGATAELKFRLYNNLDYASPCNITIQQPSLVAVARNKGYVAWADVTKYCGAVGNVIVPPHSYAEEIIRITIPEGVSHPKQWMFYVTYQSEGHRWGDYTQTDSKNYVFTPPGFDCNITDVSQQFSYLTWGNSPKLIVRKQYGVPPSSITSGDPVFEDFGKQVRYPWVDPNSGKTLERQYTNYQFTTNEILPSYGGVNLFYKAWIQHMVNGIWDGTWDAIGQSVMIPEVQAKVLVNM